LCSLARSDLASRGVRQPIQPHTFCVPLLVLDKTLVQPHLAVVNCSDAAMMVFYPPVLTRSLIFLQLWTAVSSSSSFFPFSTCSIQISLSVQISSATLESLTGVISSWPVCCRKKFVVLKFHHVISLRCFSDLVNVVYVEASLGRRILHRGEVWD